MWKNSTLETWLGGGGTQKCRKEKSEPRKCKGRRPSDGKSDEKRGRSSHRCDNTGKNSDNKQFQDEARAYKKRGSFLQN